MRSALKFLILGPFPKFSIIVLAIVLPVIIFLFVIDSIDVSADFRVRQERLAKILEDPREREFAENPVCWTDRHGEAAYQACKAHLDEMFRRYSEMGEHLPDQIEFTPFLNSDPEDLYLIYLRTPKYRGGAATDIQTGKRLREWAQIFCEFDPLMQNTVLRFNSEWRAI